MELIQAPISSRTINLEFYSAGEGERPAVIFLHDLIGIVPATRQTAKALAAIGVHVLLPDLFTGGKGAQYCVRTLFTAAIRNNEDTDNPHLEEIQEIINFVKTLPGINGHKLGIVGQCLTGGFVLHAAIRNDIKAPVVFHHSFGQRGSGIPSHCAVLVEQQIQGHFVNIDPFCPKGRVQKLKKQLGAKLEDHWYDLPHGVPHFFFNTDQGRQAFERMLNFIRLNLLEEVG